MDKLPKEILLLIADFANIKKINGKWRKLLDKEKINKFYEIKIESELSLIINNDFYIIVEIQNSKKNIKISKITNEVHFFVDIFKVIGGIYYPINEF